MSDDIEIIDLRECHFRVSNHIFNNGLSVYELGVYFCLCRYANNKNTESFPSITTLQKMLNISRPKVIESLKKLVEEKLIHKKQGHTGKSNRYYLLDLPSKRHLLVNTINQGSKPHLPEVVNPVNPKKTHIKKTNEKDSHDQELFNTFWDSYNKKIDRVKCENKWKRLSLEEKNLILAYVPRYVKATPDKQFRKHPATFLNNRSWENEIVSKDGKVSQDDLINKVDRVLKEIS